MLRKIHSLPGLVAALFIAVVGVTGAILSVDPAAERMGASLPAGLNVARLAERVQTRYPGAEQIQRTPSGALIVYYQTGSGAGADQVDPASGNRIRPYTPSAFFRWVKQLHRSLFLDTTGRIATGVTAVVMLVLCVSGLMLLVHRVGGWRALARPLHGSRSQRWHAEVGRLAIAGLLISAITGTYMSAATFGFVSDGMQDEPDFPSTTSGGPPAPVGRLPALVATDVADLRELVFPEPGDAAAVYTLRTVQGDGYVDPSSGALLAFRAHSGTREAYELLYRLHTGEGLWWFGLILGVCALTSPWMAVTGATVWWQRRRAKPRLSGNSRARSAEILILVGSENNSTWGFARVLHDALREAGRRVCTAPMNQASFHDSPARVVFVLTATYGDGGAPSSADQFLARLAQRPPDPATRFAVLGFGDRQFPKFCQFAKDVDAAFRAHGCQPALELVTINRQSSQEFARWGVAAGDMLGTGLKLEYTPVHPQTFPLCLQERIDYGREESEPTVVLRFVAASVAAPGGLLNRLFKRDRLPHFEAGDLAGIIPPGSAMPRFYSLASGSGNGVLEICVRKQPGGMCSTYLHGLRVGDRVEAFIQPNPQFRPASGKSPVILIGAGTGIGPLAGFIRNNTGKYPMYLYWGGRDPESDFLYEPELKNYLADARLTQLHTAFSRVGNGVRVQTRLTEDAENMRRLIGGGGQVLVCGSSAMAHSVRMALDEILAPMNLSVQTLRTTGRYREDVF
ncbi:nitric oxide synthase [Massilia sp. Root133]|uniref:PepSY domain-containing protein n=1 Tax=unclassified Massilia TaxID=2609279 RepID=UPI0006FE9A58|nr:MULTISPECIES: PepSY domain-containing protein [unclassified Massilia]KQY19069.1 nitric oxide synthase [Massilia sp. Root133]KQZ53382.1 nitric oxide synthase [Massilia sp. Root1485]